MGNTRCHGILCVSDFRSRQRLSSDRARHDLSDDDLAGDFGVVAMEQLLQLLRKYAIQRTWFIPGHTIETNSPVAGTCGFDCA